MSVSRINYIFLQTKTINLLIFTFKFNFKFIRIIVLNDCLGDNFRVWVSTIIIFCSTSWPNSNPADDLWRSLFLFSGAFHGHAQNCPRHDKHKDMTNINSWLKIIFQFQFGISESEITNIFQVGASRARFVATILKKNADKET